MSTESVDKAKQKGSLSPVIFDFNTGQMVKVIEHLSVSPFQTFL